jgi:hypothetical protein
MFVSDLLCFTRQQPDPLAEFSSMFFGCDGFMLQCLRVASQARQAGITLNTARRSSSVHAPLTLADWYL